MAIDMIRKSEIFLMITIGLLGVTLLFLARSLIVPFLTAAILTAICYPVYKKISLKWGRKKLSALVTVLLLLIIFIIPLIFIILGLVSEGVGVYNSVRETSVADISSRWQAALTKSSDVVGLEISKEVSEEIITSSIKSFRSGIWKSVQFVSGTLLQFVIESIFTLFFMYYLLIYGKNIYKYLELAIPIKLKSKKILSRDIYSSIRALFLGQGLVAIMQGAIAFIGFIIFGINNPLFWGFVTTVFAFIPIIGAWVVWLPLSLIAISQGNYFAGLGLMIWGAILVSTVDNFVRPYLVSSFSKIHFLVILVGVFIGIKAFNIIGIILGPLIIAVTITLAKIYYLEHIKDRKVHT